MSSVKLTSNKVTLKAGKVSCECCNDVPPDGTVVAQFDGLFNQKKYKYAALYDWDTCLFGSNSVQEGTDYDVDGHVVYAAVYYGGVVKAQVVKSTGNYADVRPVGTIYPLSYLGSTQGLDPKGYQYKIADDYAHTWPEPWCGNPDGSRIFVLLLDEVPDCSMPPRWTIWTPPASQVCVGEPFTQKRYDMNGCVSPDTQTAIGEMQPEYYDFYPFEGQYCQGTQFTQCSYSWNGCGDVICREAWGANTPYWDSEWYPNASQVCDGQSFTQYLYDWSGCNPPQERLSPELGTMQPNWSHWYPDPSWVCAGTAFTQTSDDWNGCAAPRARPAVGIASPNWSDWQTGWPGPNETCDNSTYRQYRWDRNWLCPQEEVWLPGQKQTVWSAWSPSVSDVCEGVAFVQEKTDLSGCRPTQYNNAVGTKASNWVWLPNANEICEGEQFTQYKVDLTQCQTSSETRPAVGTFEGYWSSWEPSSDSFLPSESFEQWRENWTCGKFETRTVPGTGSFPCPEFGYTFNTLWSLDWSGFGGRSGPYATIEVFITRLKKTCNLLYGCMLEIWATSRISFTCYNGQVCYIIDPSSVGSYMVATMDPYAVGNGISGNWHDNGAGYPLRVYWWNGYGGQSFANVTASLPCPRGDQQE